MLLQRGKEAITKMESINGNFTQTDFENLQIELTNLLVQQYKGGVDNSARIKEIKTFLDSFKSEDED